jgi:phosphoribosylglycinamide formyltransferase 1
MVCNVENVAMDSLARIALFASHGGSNAEAVIDACLEGRVAGRVCLLISNNSTSRALEIAQAHGIATAHLSSVTHPGPDELDGEILATLLRAEVSVLVLAGYMKRLGPTTLAAYADAILNVHPSLLPRHGGVGMFGRRVHEAVLESGDPTTGVTVHLVDASYDTGRILAQREIIVVHGDTAESLAARVLTIEHEVLVETLASFIRSMPIQVGVVEERVPEQLLAGVADAQRRLDDAVTGMSRTLVGGSSLLPGWTRAHVLAHLAANSDSHVRRSHAAVDGLDVDQYSGGAAGREQEIETRARRENETLIQEVVLSGAALLDCWQGLDPAVWSSKTKQVSGPDLTLRDLPRRRWQEIEVHLVDLDIGATYRDWSDEFVALFLPRLRTSVERRLPSGSKRPSAELDDRTELAWLYGRTQPAGFPLLLPWG